MVKWNIATYNLRSYRDDRSGLFEALASLDASSLCRFLAAPIHTTSKRYCLHFRYLHWQPRLQWMPKTITCR